MHFNIYLTCTQQFTTFSSVPIFGLSLSISFFFIVCLSFIPLFLSFPPFLLSPSVYSLSSFSSSIQPSTAWCLSGRSGQSATSPAVKDTPSGPAWSNWSLNSGAALVPKPSRGRNARLGSAGQKRRRREEEEEEEEVVVEARGEEGANREKMQPWKNRQVGGDY